jgi:glucokinase
MSNFVIGIDLGGTNVKGIVLNAQGNIVLQDHQPTHDDPHGLWRNNVKTLVDRLLQKFPNDIAAIGLSAPGLANEQNSAIAYLPNRLEGLVNFDWSSFLGKKTFVLNDAHAALMAEYSYGCLKPYQNALLLTLGTGVGGGLLINGKLHQGLSQMAGHMGHISTHAGGNDFSILGSPGSIEFAIGNYSVKERSLGRYDSTYDLVKAYETGDSWAQYVWLSSIQKLAVTMSSLINVFSPEAIALSGGITLAGESLLTPLDNFLEKYEFRPGGKQTSLKIAQFQEMAGAVGSAGFAQSKVTI